MCGINGILRLTPDAPTIELAELRATCDAMARRGPDGTGEWLAADGRIALGHRRLAILDLSPAGAQPMASPDGRFRVVLNGEIYNFRELRAELAAAGTAFHSESDTEVLLALYARHGAAMLPRLRGMFALALWDDREKTLLLARDAYGIKPLYLANEDGVLRFASQVRALAAGGKVSPAVDLGGLAGFLLWGSVPEPWTIRCAVRALPAGSYLLVRDGRLNGPHRFYRFQPPDLRTPDAPDLAAAPNLAEAFGATVAAHLVSDVPVAVFLSAGLDSSLLAALASRQLAQPLQTFTLSFDELAGTALDEAPLAAETARQLGTRHVERRVGRSDLAGFWPAALAAMDQPSIDGFNTFLVAKLAHEAGLKVALSGLGGDELLGSYPSFRDVPRGVRLARRARWLPGAAALWRAAAPRLFPGRPKLAGLLRHGATLPGAYFLRRGLFLPAELPGLLGPERAAAALVAYDPIADAAAAVEPGTVDGWTAVHELESSLYMRNQLLRDSDWASMAWSLELRVPLADPFLRAALAADGFAAVRRLGKAGLVRQLAPELPAAVFARPKTGFYIPLAEWMASAGEAPASRAPVSRALGSRGLALRVLAELGVPLHG